MSRSKRYEQGTHIWVDWVDACGKPGWCSPQEVEEFCKEPLMCQSSGFVVRDRPRSLVIAMHRASDHTFGALLEVPRGMIQDHGEIKEVK